jgi:hypothetical protein
VEEGELGVDCLGRLALEHLEQQAKLGGLDSLGVDIDAADVAEQDALFLTGCQAPLAAGT